MSDRINISVGLTADIQDFINNLQKQFGNLKGLGIDKAAENDINNIMGMLKDLSKSISDLGGTKVNASSFAKAQKEIIDKVQALEARTSALEENMTSLVSTMSQADGGKFANQMEEIAQAMNSVSEATQKTVASINNFSGESANRIGAVGENLQALEKILETVNKDFDVGMNFTSFKDAKNYLIKLYGDIQKAKQEASEIIPSTDDDVKRLAVVQQKIVELIRTFSEVYDQQLNGDFAKQFEEATIVFRESGENIEKPFDVLETNLDNTLKKIVDNVKSSIRTAKTELESLKSATIDAGTGTALISQDNKGLTVPLDISTKSSTLLKRAIEIIDRVNENLKDNPVKAEVVLTTEWGTRKSNELLKQFQKQIDSLSEDTDVTELRKLSEDISKSFSDEIQLKFSSNFDKEQKAIKAGIFALKDELKEKLVVTPKLKYKDSDLKEFQKQIDEIMDSLKITMSEDLLDNQELRQDEDSLGRIEEYLHDIGRFGLDANQALKPLHNLLFEINKVLQSNPLSEITASARELVDVMRQAFGLASPNELDAMFSNIQKSVAGISGSLKNTDNLKAIKDVLTQFREYQNAGGRNQIRELGGSKNVQSWLSKHQNDDFANLNAEAKAFEKVEATAYKAANAKSEFTLQNERASEAADETTEDVEKEAESMKEFAENSDLLRWMQEIQNGFNSHPIELGIELDKASLQNQLKEIAPEIAEAWNKQYGTSLTGKDIVKAWNDTQKQAEFNKLKEREAEISKELLGIDVRENELEEERNNGLKQTAELNNKINSQIEERAQWWQNSMDEQDANATVRAWDDAAQYMADVESATKAVNEERAKGLAQQEEINRQVAEYAKLLDRAEVNLRKSYQQNSKSLEKSFANVDATKFVPEIQERIEHIQTVIKNLKDEPLNLNDNKSVVFFDTLVHKAEELKLAMKDANNQLADKSSIGGVKNKIADFLKDNTNMSKKFRAELQEMYNTLENGSNITKPALKAIDTRFRDISASVKQAGQAGDSFFTKIGKQLTSLNANLIATYLSWRDIIRYIRSTAEAVTKLDSALTELRKVSDASTERLAQSFEKSAQTAQELGSTISHVINVTADWARLGYDVDAAEELARVTTLFTTVGDNMSADDASSFLISSLQGFQLSAEQAEDIVDKYNEVANNFAIDTRGIGAALERSAASFYAANTDISKSIALVTTANSVVQNPEAVGTTFKTLSARIRGAKTELEELGEEEDEFTKTTSKLRDLVKGLTGFDIMEDEETYKDIYDIIVGIGKEWKNLSDIERASLGEALAGKRNSNALFAVLNNIETLEKAYQTAEESAGSAAKEQENYSKSVQYSIDRVKASLEELAYDFLNSKALKGAIEAFNSFIRVVDAAVEHLGLLQTSLLAIGGGVAIANLGSLTTKFKELSALGAMSSILKGGFEPNKIESLVNALSGLNEAQKIATVSSLKLSEADATRVLVEAGVEKQTISNSIADGALATSEATATGATWSLSAAFKGLAASLGMSTAALGGVVIAITAIGAIGYGAYKHNKRFEEMAEKADEAKNNIKELKAELDASETTVSNLAKRYEELSRGVNTLSNKNISLSNEEYKEYLDIVNQLAEKYPQLYNTLDDNGNAILNFSDKTKSATENLDDFLKKERETADYHIAEEIDTLYGGLTAKNKDIEDATTKLETFGTAWETTIDKLDQLAQTNVKLDWTDSELSLLNAFNSTKEVYKEMLELEGLADNVDLDKIFKKVGTSGGTIKINTEGVKLDERQLQLLELAIEQEFSAVKGDVYDNLKELQTGLSVAEESFQNDWIDFTENLAAATRSRGSYQRLGETSQELAYALVGNLSSDVYEQMDGDPKEWVNRHILSPLTMAAKEDTSGEFSKLVAQLLTLSDDDLNRIDIANQIQQWLDDHNIEAEIDLTPVIKDSTELQNSIENVIRKYAPTKYKARGNVDQNYLSKMTEATKKLSAEDQKDILVFTEKEWQKVNEEIVKSTGNTNAAKASTDAVANALKTVVDRLHEVSTAESQTTLFDNSKFSEQVNELDALQSAYEKFISNISSDDATKINLDISDVEALREKFGQLENFDFDQFELVVTSDTSGIDDIQKAFDEALTAYARTKIELEGINEETKDMVRTQLEMEGATHESAEAFVNDALSMANAKRAIAEAGVDVENATEDEINSLLDEADQLGVTQAELLEYLILHGNADSSVWNIDLSALIDEYEQLGLNCDALREYNGLKGNNLASKAYGNGKTSFSSYEDYLYGQSLLNSKKEDAKTNVENNQAPLNFSSSSNRRAGGGAGKEAGDAYVDAFNKELEKLKDAYERGDISLKDYLAQWKALIQKFFADNPKYAEEYANQMKSYLDAVKGYYSGAISGVTTILQGRISALQRQKDKAIKQLEKEKAAALEVYDVQIKAIEKTIKAKQKQIKQLEKEKKAIEAKKKPLQDEIKAIQDANTERERELQLQKDLYELERLQNQRTQFVLKDGQMVYQADATAARDQREQVKKDEDEQKIAALEKQIEAYDKQIELIDQRIEAINEEIELLEEEKELLEEQRAAVEEYYDKLIKETEEMFDEMIEGLEEVLEKWQQLAEIETIANAWKQGGEVFEAMGLTIEDVLNDAPGAFEKFRDAWIQVLMDSENGNKQYAEGIKEWGRQNEQTIDGVVDNYKKLGSEGSAAIDPLKTPLDEATTSTKNFGDAAATSTGSVGGLSTATGDFAKNASDADEKAGNLKDTIENLPEQLDAIDKVTFEGIIGQLEELRLKLAEIKAALGTASTGEGGVQSLGGMGSIAGALGEINNTSLADIINQFTLLETAISSVCTLLGGGAPATNGGMGGTGAQNLAPNGAGMTSAATNLLTALQELQSISFADGITKQFQELAEAIGLVAAAIGVGGADAEAEGGSLISALEALGETASSVLGGGGGEGEGEGSGKGKGKGSGSESGEGGEASGGIIGQFEDLTTKIGETAEAIGTTESDEGSEDLIGSIVSLGIKNDEVLNGGENGNGVISDWEEFNAQLSEASASITEMVEGLENLQDSYETELTVKLTIEGGGMFTGTATLGKSKGNYSLNILEAIGLPGSGGEWLTELKRHATGTAKLSGKANLFGDWAYEGGKTLIGEIGPELVVFPDGHFETYDRPQMVNLPRGSVIFNHLQTADILDKKNQVPRFGKSNANGTIDGLTPLTGAALNDMVNLAQAIGMDTDVMKMDIGDIKRHTEEISKSIQNVVNHDTSTANVTFGDLNFTCNGISTPEVLNEVQNALNQTFEGMALNAYQRAMAR